MNRDRHDDVKVVALAAQDRMRRHVDRDVQVARRATANAGVALAANAHAVAVGDARGNADGHRFRPRVLTGAPARLAGPRPLLPAAGTARTAAREHHVTADRADCPGALTEMAGAGADPRHAGPCAGAAVFAPRDGHLSLGPGQRVFEGQTHILVEIGAALLAGCARPALGEDFREQIAERRRVVDAARREIESLE